jgi:pimeloyl-ACP methyl ester carboxylesterase
MHRRFTMSDGTDIRFTDHGSGPPLLLLHGFGGAGDDFGHVFDVQALARSFRLVVPDARGHGSSTNPRGTFTFRRCAEDIVELLGHLRIASICAIGVSLGAKTLLHVATRHPALVERMVLVSAAPRFPEPTRALMRAAAAAEHPATEWAAMREKHLHGDAQIEALFRLPSSFADDATDMSFTEEQLARIRARAFVVAGERDPLYPLELSEELRAIPGCTFWAVPGGGHSPIFEAARDEFVRRALAFL